MTRAAQAPGGPAPAGPDDLLRAVRPASEAGAVAQDHRHRQVVESSPREVQDLKRALDAHAIMATTDARGVIIDVNDKFCEISGYSRAELIGQTHRIVNSGHHPPEFFAQLWSCIAAGSIWTGDILNRAKGGSTYWVHTTIVPIGEANAPPSRYIAIRNDITARKLAEEHATRLAFYDPLTSLPNRRLLADRLKQAIAQARRTGVAGALLLLDLDDFKSVNDALSHHHGDDLLQIAASRIVHQVREVDTVARMGGDEFVVILGGLSPDRERAGLQALQIAEGIARSLGEPCTLRGVEVLTSASIGVAMLPDGGVGSDELLMRADMAMYRAKSLGRSRVALYEAELEAATREQAFLTAELHHALERRQLEVHYQPIVDCEGETVGHEALMRWCHPVRGWVPPATFIPAAERAGLVVQLGRWVFEVACRRLAGWARDPQRSRWTLSVNVSARQFREPRFDADLIESAIAHGIVPERLKIEITEGTLLSWHEGAKERLEALQNFGFRLSLDDFGTGYSSLDYLSRLPLNELKVDQAFVRELTRNRRAHAIVSSVIGLARNLGMTVVAEGVETREQFAALRAMNCELFQGYLFGRPAPLADSD